MMVNLRVRLSELTRIDELATELGMSRTEYMTRSALQELPASTLTVEGRLGAVEAAIQRLQDLATF
jgi:hypothetical protein